jgi:hypothetical protein
MQVYHLGKLQPANSSSSSGSMSLLWRTNWDEEGGVLDTLCFELQQLAAELDPKPREHEAVLLLGELASYLSDWHTPAQPVARQFAAMTSRVADALQLQINKEEQQGNDEVVGQLIAKQSRSRMLSLLCYNTGELAAANVRHMLQLTAQIKHNDIYFEGDAKIQQDLALLRARCHNAMVRRLPDITAVLAAQPALVTAAVPCVLEQVPDQLAWQKLHQLKPNAPNDLRHLASYQAVSSEGSGRQHLYSFNVLDGTVLLDGAPPGRLPLEVTSHPKFIRTFGR